MTTSRLQERPVGTRSGRVRALAVSLLLVAAAAPATVVQASVPPIDAAPPPVIGDPQGSVQPTIQYEEALAHAGDRIPFSAGERVTVPFRPRGSDRWTVADEAPRSLPSGRLSGRAIRAGVAVARFDPKVSAADVSSRAVGPVDTPWVDPRSAARADLAAAVNPGGLRREVFGFLPYWELTDPSTRLDWSTLSTIAYFGVGAAANGDLQRRNADGSTTVGWSGWTSSKLTGVINSAHANGTRVVLTVQSFAWSSSGVTRQKALLGSATARGNLARQIAAAVRDRGADGVNLDFEPIVSTYADEFVALVRTLRAELNKVARGYQLTFDTTGWIGNYPIGAGTAAGAADAVVIMGYDYRGGSSNPVGSVAPIGGSSYDVTDTVKAYVARVPASKVILAVPYYGRAWSTDSSAPHARNISGTKNGSSVTVVYGVAHDYALQHGRKWDAVEGVAWTSYRRQNCTAAYGCVNPWREIYYDDPQALGLKYDVINRYNLRGAGIWALGYDGTRPELYQELKDKFVTDTIPPRISSATLSTPIISPNGDGRLDATTMRVNVTGHVKFGWIVQPVTASGAGPAVRTGTMTAQPVVYTWYGTNNAGVVVPNGRYRITIWTADASNNRASVSRDVTVDRLAAVLGLSAAPTSISPNGDGRSDRTALTLRADALVTGSARILDSTGAGLRRWSFANAGSGAWTWDGRDGAGRTVADGRYTFRVWALDRAGNSSLRDLTVRVDRTIRSLTWSRSSFIAAAGQKARVSFVLGRPATVTVSIYRGDTMVRGVWKDRPLAGGSYAWTWNGRTTSGALMKAGTYRVVVTAVSWIGSSTMTRTIVVKAP